MSNDMPQEAKQWPRIQLLNEALGYVSKDRNSAYGQPEDNFQNIADLWNVYLRQRFGPHAIPPFNSMDVAYLMIHMKMARLATNQAHHDSLVDVAGYAACGADCQERWKKEQVAGNQPALR